MKVLNYVLIGIVLTLGLWGYWQKTQVEQSQENVAMLESVVDSIRAIEATPPDTIVKTDTILSDTTIYVTTEFKKPEPDDSINHYKDSVVNEDIRVWVDVYADQLFDIEWQYEPVIKQRVKEINTPYPVVVEKPVKTVVEPQGIYGTGGIGFGEGFVGRVGIGYMPNSKYMYGIDVSKVGDKTIWGAHVSVKLFN